MVQKKRSVIWKDNLFMLLRQSHHRKREPQFVESRNGCINLSNSSVDHQQVWKLGLFIPLIVVNCVVLGRAEAFANKNGVLASALDGIGVGIGFTLSLTVIGIVREILGSGSIFGWKFIAGDGILAFVMAPGAFMVLGYLMVLFNKYLKK